MLDCGFGSLSVIYINIFVNVKFLCDRNIVRHHYGIVGEAIETRDAQFDWESLVRSFNFSSACCRM